MTLHAPAQHAGLADHHWLRDILIVGVVAVLTISAVWALSGLRINPPTTMTEAQQLVEFRAAERAALGVATTTQQQSITDYRAGERGTTITIPAVNHHPGERVPYELTPQ
jgi:hypothetical protein